MFTRPKPGDSEDDILAMQEAFFAEKKKNENLQPAAKIVNLRKHKTSDVVENPDPKQTKYSSEGDVHKSNEHKSNVHFGETTIIDENDSSENKMDVKNEPEDNVYYPTALAAVLGGIVEKNTDENIDFNLKNEKPSNSGFPEVKKRDKSVISGRKSIFAQQMKLKREKQNSTSSSKDSADTKETVVPAVKTVDCEGSFIVQGQESDRIHEENSKTLNAMTEKEILEEQEKLTSMMDPKLLDFIRSLREKNMNATPPVKSEKCEQKMEVVTTPVVKTEAISKNDTECENEIMNNDVISHPHLKDWVNFDTLEKDKLQWIKYMNKEEKAPDDKPYEARFDFKGYLLPYTIEYTEETKTLFHHGDEPHRPGYSITELFQLCRSSVTQQRALAISTLAGILEYHSIGIYDGVIHIPITKIFFVLRFALDENIPIVLEPTLRALRNMFYNRVDETCLDFLLGSDKGLFQPRLMSTKEEIEDTESDVSELKDFHLADLDLIRGSLRTDILARLRYIISIVKPSFSCVEFCLQILIRIARDADDNVNELINFEGLLSFIIENYFPKSFPTMILFKNTHEKYKITLNALKLVRILSCQSKAFAELCYNKFGIFSSILHYIGNMVADDIGLLKIQIEAMYLWSTFLGYTLGMSELLEIKGLFLRILDNHVRGTNVSYSFPVIMHSHAAALIFLLSSAKRSLTKSLLVTNSDQIKDFDDLILLVLKKWISQMCSVDKFSSGHLRSVSAAFIYMDSTVAVAPIWVENNIIGINSCLLALLKSNGFHKVSSVLIKSSSLLSNISISSEQKNTNLPGLCSSMLENSQNLPPTMNGTSPFNFLSSLSKYLVICKNPSLIQQFLCHENICSYIIAISSSSQLNLSNNWFTRIELQFLSHILHLYTNTDFPDSQKEIYYNLSFKLSYILTPEFKASVEFILKNIVFKKDCFSTERLLRNLNLDETNDILNNLNSILECYLVTLKINYQEDFQSFVIKNWAQTVLPRDWIYMPILGLYSKSQDQESVQSGIAKYLSKAIEEQTKNIVKCCLEWILVSELYFPEITGEISLTDRFCRLSCVFLCDNSLFLDPTINSLLQKCLMIIFETERSVLNKNKLDFDKPLLGVNNFQDLYTQLVDQFQAVSYGDATFSSCILVPLAQKHNMKWRKLVWSEYAACLRALDCPEEILPYSLIQYLQPDETDFSLLKSYHRALVSNLVRPGTIAYKIAQHHVEMVKNRQKAMK